MILAALLLQASALDAERAFDATAAAKGQWTAFRTWAAPDAVMFVPQPVNAPTWLKDRKDPAKSVRWQPTASWIACDGKWAVNTGAWQRPDGSTGYFTTVWHRRSDGAWRWLVDGGDALVTPRMVPATPSVRHAACGRQGRSSGFGNEANSGYGASGDATLRWRWHVDADGARRFTAELWNGRGYDVIVDDRIAA